MSSYADLCIRGVSLFSFRNMVDPTMLFLFTAEDVRRPTAAEIVRMSRYSRTDPVDLEDREFTVLMSTVGALTDRLDSLGIGPALASSVLKDLRSEALQRDLSVSPDILRPHYAAEADAWASLTFETWVDRARRRLSQLTARDKAGLPTPGSLRWLLSVWDEVDQRVALRAILEILRRDEVVELDVTDLEEGGWLDEPFDPQAVALTHFGHALANGAPPIVLTEGSTDAMIISDAVRCVAPHLNSYIRVPDFSAGMEGSVGALVRTIRAFHAAGIANRVVALFDNDTAAVDAVRGLRTSRLPRQFSILHLPELPLARSYPTLGPGGLSEMNVNGLAGSIEMYLGEDVLRGADGALMPVQWTGYVAGVGHYQGELVDKRKIQRLFKERVRTARASGALPADQDWSGLQLIVSTLLEHLATVPGGYGPAPLVP